MGRKNIGNKDYVRVVVFLTGWLMVPFTLIGSIGGLTQIGGRTCWEVRKWEVILWVPYGSFTLQINKYRCPTVKHVLGYT